MARKIILKLPLRDIIRLCFESIYVGYGFISVWSLLSPRNWFIIAFGLILGITHFMMRVTLEQSKTRVQKVFIDRPEFVRR